MLGKHSIVSRQTPEHSSVSPAHRVLHLGSISSFADETAAAGRGGGGGALNHPPWGSVASRSSPGVCEGQPSPQPFLAAPEGGGVEP